MEAVRKLEEVCGELYEPRGSWAVGRHYLHPKGRCGAACSVPQLLLLKRVPSTDPYAPGTKEYDGGPLLGASAAHYTPGNNLRRAVTADEMLAAEVYDVRRRAFDSYEASLSMGKLAWLIPWYGQVRYAVVAAADTVCAVKARRRWSRCSITMRRRAVGEPLCVSNHLSAVRITGWSAGSSPAVIS